MVGHNPWTNRLDFERFFTRCQNGQNCVCEYLSSKLS